MLFNRSLVLVPLALALTTTGFAALFSDVGVQFNGVAGNPAGNPACNATQFDGSADTITNCTVFSMTNPAVGGTESLLVSGYGYAN